MIDQTIARSCFRMVWQVARYVIEILDKPMPDWPATHIFFFNGPSFLWKFPNQLRMPVCPFLRLVLSIAYPAIRYPNVFLVIFFFVFLQSRGKGEEKNNTHTHARVVNTYRSDINSIKIISSRLGSMKIKSNREYIWNPFISQVGSMKKTINIKHSV